MRKPTKNMRKKGSGNQKQYHVKAEMRRLADAIYEFIDRHDGEDSRIALEALKEARHLAKLACDSQVAAATGNAAAGALAQLEGRLRQRGMLPSPAAAHIPIDVTPDLGGSNGRDDQD